jgi:hypothetical protein
MRFADFIKRFSAGDPTVYLTTQKTDVDLEGRQHLMAPPVSQVSLTLTHYTTHTTREKNDFPFYLSLRILFLSFFIFHFFKKKIYFTVGAKGLSTAAGDHGQASARRHIFF